MVRLWALGLILFSSHSLHARVFDFKSASTAPYIRGTGGTDPMGQDAFIHSSGSGTEIKSKSNYNYSGEVGVSLGFADAVNLRLGAELVSAIPVSNASGTNSTSGAERFLLNSNLTVFNPNVTFEILFHQRQTYRFYSLLGVGYAIANLTNSYKMTTPGTSELGVNDYDEKAIGKSVSYTVGVGFETTFADNVTMSLDTGYRYLQFQNLTHTGAGKTIAQGTVAEGDILKNSDGSARRLDLGGPYVGITFRFYLNFGP